MAVKTTTWISFRSVTLAFAICGLASSPLFNDNDNQVFQLVALPFSLLCAFLIGRSILGIVVVPGICLSWFAAHLSAFFFSMAFHLPHPADYFFGLAIGGVIGATGTFLCMSVAWRHFNLHNLFVVCLVSIGASVPFVFWAQHEVNGFDGPDAFQPIRAACAFAVWQTSVGGCLFLMSQKPQKSSELPIVPKPLEIG